MRNQIDGGRTKLFRIAAWSGVRASRLFKGDSGTVRVEAIVGKSENWEATGEKMLAIGISAIALVSPALAAPGQMHAPHRNNKSHSLFNIESVTPSND